MEDAPKHLPQGAGRCRDGTVRWRVWAPFSPDVTLVTWPAGQRCDTPMTPEGFGYFAHRQNAAEEGLRYAYRLADGRDYPDPASRWQPDGVHQPSALWFAEAFSWTDGEWRGVPRKDLVFYELHVGTFTPEGTFAAIVPRLADLDALGVTALEIMPVGQFPENRNWGYDGAHPYAVQQSYGGPRGLQELVNAAHGAGLAVFLDVVYNHLGPEGNYLGKFGPYFTDRYRTPWGSAVNFDGRDSDAVRQYFIDNACAWVRDFHVDGLRLDAVHAIYDFGARHILADLEAAAEKEAAGQHRIVHVIAESNQNDVRLIDPTDRGGYGLAGVWADDFHHAVHALLTGERDGYYVDFGDPEHLAKGFCEVFVYDGVYSRFRRRRHGSKLGSRERTKFVVCLQNHDQVGNRARGDRVATLLPPAAVRLACGLLLVSPCTPLLFMGEEYGETRPFPFFCSYGDPELIEAVRRGRRAEFAALEFQWNGVIPDPQAEETFRSAVLEWSWPAGSWRAKLRRLYQDLLAARRSWPPLDDREHTTADLLPIPGDKDGRTSLLVIERGSDERLVACANLNSVAAPLESNWLTRFREARQGAVGKALRGVPGTAVNAATPPRGTPRRAFPSAEFPRTAQDHGASPHPDPLPVGEGTNEWAMIFSTEDRRYGGERTEGEPAEMVLPYELLVFGDPQWRLPMI